MNNMEKVFWNFVMEAQNKTTYVGLSTACLAICKARRHTTFENGLNQRFSSEPKSLIHLFYINHYYWINWHVYDKINVENEKKKTF